jgi:pyruvate/2-oxoglutarate dehydrogenase complex dihydrolipoamide dehydrogenase (E3) component
MFMKSFDAIVIGAGQAGVPLAKKLAAAGWKTVLIEKRWIGGTCINDGCTPTKTMVASARMAYMAGKSKDLGVDIPAYRLNFKTVMQRKDHLVSLFREGAFRGIEKTPNLSVVYGEAKFIADHQVQVMKEDRADLFEAKHIFINTGALPFVPEIEGLSEIKFLTSTSIMELEDVPSHLLIVGCGYIGMEFGQMFKRFGAEVTLLEQGDRLLPHEDEDVCREMSTVFQEEGIKVLLQTKAVRFENYGDVRIRVTTLTDGEEAKHMCSHVLIASGRDPQTRMLGLENTNIICNDRGYIKVNDHLETGVKGVYALGDVKGGPAFTHIAYNDHLVLIDHLLHGGKKGIKGRLLPYCMFTDPQLGRVGINELQAKELGLDIVVAKIPMKNVARALENGETRGFMKAIADKKTKLLLGAAVIGEQGGEIMSILQMAMVGKITYDQIRKMIFAHPLYAESLNNLFMSLDD